MMFNEIELSSVITDIAAGPFGSNLKVSCFVPYGFPIIDGANLKGFKVTDNLTKFVTEDKARSLGRSIARRGDVVVTISGTLGQIAYIPNDSMFEEYLCSQRQFRVSFDASRVYVPYLVFYFHTNEGQSKILAFANQTGVPALSQPLKNFKKIRIHLPSYDEQRRIASVIESINDKIDCNQKINDNLQQQLRTIFKAEFTDNPELEKMTQIPLSELCHVVTKGTTPTTLGKPFVESGINFIKAESILADHSLDKSKFAFIDEETNALLKRSVIHAGDVVFTIAGTLGRFALIDDNVLPANTNQAVAIIRADAEKVLPEYIYTCFIGEWHTDYYAKRVQQAVQANLSLTTIKSLPIPVLDKAKMDEYLRLILPLIKAIKGNEAQNEKLAALRDALLPKLMSGEIDVSDIQL